jgi:hypothetical protein
VFDRKCAIAAAVEAAELEAGRRHVAAAGIDELLQVGLGPVLADRAL